MSRILKVLSETKKDDKGFMPTPRQVPAPPGGHPVPPGYERVKSWGGAYELRKKTTEGEVVSLQARKTPLVVAGSPYDWDIYDLRTNKMVANILGGDRSESPLYEIRINRNGMTPTTRMLPTYVLRAGRNNNPPYKAYELVDTPERYGKIEKSPGPGGTTKLRPDEDDMLRHMFKVMGGGKYYGYDLDLVEEGLDQYEIIEKALGAKIMEIDDAMELGYTDWDPEDSSSIIYLGNKKDKDKKDEGYSAGAAGGAGLGEQEDNFIARPNSDIMVSIKKLAKTPNGKMIKLPGGYAVVDQNDPRPEVKPNVKKVLKQKELKRDYIELKTQFDNLRNEYDLKLQKSANKRDPKLEKIIDDLYKKMIQARSDYTSLQLKPNHFDVKEPEQLSFNIEGQIYSTGGGAGQSYRKFRPKSSGILEGILKEYDTKTIDSVVERLPKGLTVNNFTIPAFKEFLYQKYYSKVKAGWDKLYPFFNKEYNEKHGIKEYKQDPHQILSGDINFFDDMLLVIPKGLKSNELYTQAFKEFLYKKFADREWTDFKKNRYAYWDAYQKIGGDKKDKKFFGLFDEEEQIDELKCWPGYTRVKGVPAGAPGSCKKKAKESSIIKGIQSEDDTSK